VYHEPTAPSPASSLMRFGDLSRNEAGEVQSEAGEVKY
jgi:hypothetical protein